MALLDASHADKNIVDRRKQSRNRDMSVVVRSARDRLMQHTKTERFDRELLFMHTRALIVNAATIPLLIAIVTVTSIFAGFGQQMIAWACFGIGLYALLGLLARQIDRSGIRDDQIRQWQLVYLSGHFLTGIGWTYFILIDCAQCGVSQFSIIKAVVLILAMAITAVFTSALRTTVPVAFLLPVVAYISTAWDSLANPVQATMVVMLLAGLTFFYLVATRLNYSVVLTLALQAEKDALIAELETANAMSDEGRRRAEEANLAKSRFLASMSHELRTPLNAILGFSEVMAKEVLGPIENGTYREYAGDIHASGEHLLNLINEILDLSRIEAGRHSLSEEPLMLTDVANECIRMMTLKARNKNITIISQFEYGMLPMMADERSLRQILLNLMANAVKFTPANGKMHVKIGWTAGGGQYLSVRDTGPGIPADEIPVVLSAFGQGSIAIKSAEQGTGLGLPIVQALVHVHDGEFHLFSKLREGTEALATFPRSRVVSGSPKSRLAAQKQKVS
ncbi:HAMP domain-containing sensor histidine kinase [Phyllobacterium sp. YR531]|uniref:sensor histidine kinase n=1 Tax=Phyllobacterium sp. YR531 TaxID=1144343 RepID=UPI00026F6C7F|nr:HAMP domain-containing sensor histidine kinase [Phyllobacterium sp. YR531]EJN03901.1 signal transduction histidine kinase [Phyllobacterium sp. YR531]